MMRSDAPCAMATTFASAPATALKIRAAMPGVCTIPEPTTAIVERPVISSMSSISRRLISSTNASRSAATARGASTSGTVKQIECSDDACEIIETETPVDASAPNVRAATPGTPIIPLPCTVTSACLRMAERARTGEPPAGRPGTIVVPADSGFANGRMRRMVPCWRGTSVRGCSTLAP